MSEKPWYRRYPSDFLHGTAGLPLEVKGAYSVVLDLIYDRRGPIPDNAHWIAGHCGCSVRKWNTIRATLIDEGKIVAEGGFIINPRAMREVDISAETARKLAENGAKGGNKSAETRKLKAEKNAEESNISGLAEAGLEAGSKHRARVLNPETRNNPIVPNSKSDIEAAFLDFKAAYPKRDGSQDWTKARTRFGSLVGKGTDPGRLVASATAYRREVERKGNLGTSYVKQAATFLSGAWEEYGEAPNAIAASPASAPALPPDWPHNLPHPDRVRDAMSRRLWPGTWGAPPGQPGCRLSPAVLEKFGLAASLDLETRLEG
ncbi:MAG: hypothetical protein K0S00_2883 [Xanthobacteraceae bacterium]|jgi:uncharacterized protein YdaU (DUF1376 family)|nr:hypothetical protein [Xanthobacteraceae bacterium]